MQIWNALKSLSHNLYTNTCSILHMFVSYVAAWRDASQGNKLTQNNVLVELLLHPSLWNTWTRRRIMLVINSTRLAFLSVSPWQHCMSFADRIFALIVIAKFAVLRLPFTLLVSQEVGTCFQGSRNQGDKGGLGPQLFNRGGKAPLVIIKHVPCWLQQQLMNSSMNYKTNV